MQIIDFLILYISGAKEMLLYRADTAEGIAEILSTYNDNYYLIQDSNYFFTGHILRDSKGFTLTQPSLGALPLVSIGNEETIRGQIVMATHNKTDENYASIGINSIIGIGTGGVFTMGMPMGQYPYWSLDNKGDLKFCDMKKRTILSRYTRLN